MGQVTITGCWKTEWIKRRKYFHKQLGIVEKTVEKQVGKKHGFFSLFSKAKKVQTSSETKLEKLFGALEDARKAVDKATPAKRDAALKTFEATLKAASKAADAFVAKAFMDVSNKAAEEGLNPAQLKQKRKDIAHLSEILQDDVDTLVTNAHAWLLEERAGKPNSVAEAVKGPPTKVLKAKLLANIKKSLTRLKKLSRDPEVGTFNSAISPITQDVSAQMRFALARFTSRDDQAILRSVAAVLDPWRGGRLKEEDGFDTVLIEIGKVENALMALGKWTSKLKA